MTTTQQTNYGVNEIAEIFPSLLKIGDQSLREKVAAVWNEAIKKAIISALRTKELTHTELSDRLNKDLKGKFSGNISWYGETVKLDLEARKIIQRNTEKPPKYRLKKK